MKITKIKTIVRYHAEDFDDDVNAFLAEVGDDLLYIDFDGDDCQYIARIIYRADIKK